MTDKELVAAVKKVAELQKKHETARDDALTALLRDDADTEAVYLREAALANICEKEIERLNWERGNTNV